MITPVAAVIFAAAMALSLSVEADSFFHTPTPSANPDAELDAPTVEDGASEEGKATTTVTAGESAAEP